jgi:predicted HD phosphohydrolase
MLMSEPARPGVVSFADLAALEAFLRTTATRPCEEPGLSELDHSLQCAAELERLAPDDLELQVAGLVHDISHSQCHISEHDRVGADALRPILGERLGALVGLHVHAKRYLVATDAAYRGRLSRVSIHTLELQGGAMTPDEVKAFEASPFSDDAVRLRIADEAAKVAGKVVAGLEHWLPALRSVAGRR